MGNTIIKKNEWKQDTSVAGKPFKCFNGSTIISDLNTLEACTKDNNKIKDGLFYKYLEGILEDTSYSNVKPDLRAAQLACEKGIVWKKRFPYLKTLKCTDSEFNTDEKKTMLGRYIELKKKTGTVGNFEKCEGDSAGSSSVCNKEIISNPNIKSVIKNDNLKNLSTVINTCNDDDYRGTDIGDNEFWDNRCTTIDAKDATKLGHINKLTLENLQKTDDNLEKMNFCASYKSQLKLCIAEQKKYFGEEARTLFDIEPNPDKLKDGIDQCYLDWEPPTKDIKSKCSLRCSNSAAKTYCNTKPGFKYDSSKELEVCGLDDTNDTKYLGENNEKINNIKTIDGNTFNEPNLDNMDARSMLVEQCNNCCAQKTQCNDGLTDDDKIGYDYDNKQITDPSADSYKGTINCLENYKGTPTITCESGNVALNGCEPKKCTIPSDFTIKHNIVQNPQNLNIDGFNVKYKCKSGDTTTVYNAQVCDNDNEDFKLDSSSRCTAPTNSCLVPNGYNPSKHKLANNVVWTKGDNFNVTASCADGYNGTVTFDQCAAVNQEATITDNCKLDKCTQPTLDEGVEVEETNLERNNFNVNASCKAGFYEKASLSTTKCTKNNTQYKINGKCDKIKCTHPINLPARYKKVKNENENLTKKDFNVKYICDPKNYELNDKSKPIEVKSCIENNKPYTVVGECKEKIVKQTAAPVTTKTTTTKTQNKLVTSTGVTAGTTAQPISTVSPVAGAATPGVVGTASPVTGVVPTQQNWFEKLDLPLKIAIIGGPVLLLIIIIIIIASR